MEQPSDGGKPSPETRYLRPPGLEFGRGIAIFILVFAVFAMAQMCLLIWQVMTRTPAYADRPFSMALLEEPTFQEGWRTLATNGDVVSILGLGAGLVAALVLFLSVRSWKGDGWWRFLALQRPTGRALGVWLVVFLLFFTVMEVLVNLVPGFDSAFMEAVLGSVTSYGMLFLGVVLMPALFEELLFRGVLFGSLRYLMDKHAAVALSAGIFTLVHPQYDWQLQLLYLLPMAVFLGYARANSGSLWTSILLHAVNNALSVLLPIALGGS